MEFRILINDLWKDETGINQVFLQIEINDGIEIWNKAARLCFSEVTQIVADPKSIDEIALNMANRAVLERPQEKVEEENIRMIKLEEAKQETLKLEIELTKPMKTV